MNDEMGNGKVDKATLRWKKIEEYLNKTHNYIMNADVRELCVFSAAMANRIFALAVADGKLEKYRSYGHWCYKFKKRKSNSNR